MDAEELRGDLAAFADDEQEVAIDPSGNFVLLRHGREVSGRLYETVEGQLMVEREGVPVSYRSFLTHELANLPALAERLAARRHAVRGFVDGTVEIRRPAEDPSSGSALDTLRAECESGPAFAARISFITADAGHGKTALLREYQQKQAEAFLSGESSYVFWHLDLQGRQLLRLSEALMGDLGDLRVTGLWMPALIRLMRHRALILAIDGFDELAAEQGGTDALGALSALVTQLGGRGTVVAAARRTFFDTEDYILRAGMVGRALASPCQFDQIVLQPWTSSEVVQYFAGKLTIDAKARAAGAYADILAELGGEESHPMLTRPFLVAQLARAIFEFELPAADFLRPADDPMGGVAAIVDAFVKREVSEKWKFRDTGEPYLAQDQHMQFLADVAEEMYRGQKDRLPLDVIETLAALLLEQWNIDPTRRQQIIEMVRMHVLLVPPPDGDQTTRGFDHPEFRDYFTAYALRSHVQRVMEGEPADDLGRFLSIAQISDSTARYVCDMISRTESRVRTFASAVADLVSKEWKPTFLQVNVGTLIPFMLDDVTFQEELEFGAKVIYSSLVFERTRLKNVTLAGGAFVNASLLGANWDQVTLRDCNLGELTVDHDANFTDVHLERCTADGLRIQNGDEEQREYAPERIWAQLAHRGAVQAEQEILPFDEDPELTDKQPVRIFRRLLRVFSRTTVISEIQLENRFRQDHHFVVDKLIPLLETHGVLAQRTWKGAGTTRIWALERSADEVLASEFAASSPDLADFWVALKRLKL